MLNCWFLHNSKCWICISVCKVNIMHVVSSWDYMCLFVMQCIVPTKSIIKIATKVHWGLVSSENIISYSVHIFSLFQLHREIIGYIYYRTFQNSIYSSKLKGNYNKLFFFSRLKNQLSSVQFIVNDICHTKTCIRQIS